MQQTKIGVVVLVAEIMVIWWPTHIVYWLLRHTLSFIVIFIRQQQ